MKAARDIWTSKATWTGIAAILTALAAAYAGEITWEAAIAAVFASLQSVWIRDTIRKATTPPLAEPASEPRRNVPVP